MLNIRQPHLVAQNQLPNKGQDQFNIAFCNIGTT